MSRSWKVEALIAVATAKRAKVKYPEHDLKDPPSPRAIKSRTSAVRADMWRLGCARQHQVTPGSVAVLFAKRDSEVLTGVQAFGQQP